MMKIQYPPPTPREAELIRKCEEFGVKVSYIYDFVREPEKYVVNRKIASLLAGEIEKEKDKSFAAILMNACALPEFRDIMLPPTVKYIRREGGNAFGQMAVNVLGKIVLPQDSDLVANLLCDQSIGDSRSLLISIYARIAKKAAIPVLQKIVDDPDTHVYALHYLSILGDTSIEAELQKLLKHPNGDFRKIARDGLKRVDKNKQKIQRKTLN